MKFFLAFVVMVSFHYWLAAYEVNEAFYTWNRKPVKILPIGNSITNGTDTFSSYRRDLWHLLANAHLNVDFIGSWNRHHNGGAVPHPDFDMDHEGHSGWTTADMFHPPAWDSSRGNIVKWLTEYRPDIVLMELGTNDIFQCRKPEEAVKDISRLVEVLRSKNAAVKIFIAQIPPLGARWSNQRLCGNDITYDESLRKLNRLIAGLCKELSTKRSLVTAVDQYTGIDPAVDMYDDIHPNTSGEAIIARRWFDAIKQYLPKLSGG